VNLLPSAEQQELVASARRFVATEMPVGTQAGGGAPDKEGPNKEGRVLWRRMAALGWLSLGVAPDHGGAGSITDQALLFRELGRGLVPGPVLGTALASAVAVAGGRDDLASSLMAGDATAALAEPWRDASAGISDRARVTGCFRVLDLDEADYVTFLTRDGAAVLAAGPLRAVALPLPSPDPSVPVALAQLAGAAGAAGGDGVVVLGERQAAGFAAHGRTLAAGLLVGVLEAVRDMSVAYVLGREQFGKPIGSFQAVKHRCADMAVRCEAAGSLVWLAALSVDAGAPEADRLAASAKALASEYAVASAHDNVQNHGGMGFTAECAAHLYVKRALEWSVTLGSPEVLLAEVAR
jgi:alkylation response protein AidB-like acyl-CoA dehydrogenase